jgi:hypothetical protein
MLLTLSIRCSKYGQWHASPYSEEISSGERNLVPWLALKKKNLNHRIKYPLKLHCYLSIKNSIEKIYKHIHLRMVPPSDNLRKFPFLISRTIPRQLKIGQS